MRDIPDRIRVPMLTEWDAESLYYDPNGNMTWRRWTPVPGAPAPASGVSGARARFVSVGLFSASPVNRQIVRLPLALPHRREPSPPSESVRPKFYPLMDTFDDSSQVASNL